MNQAFFLHQRLAFWRSENTGKSIIVKVLLGLTLLYVFANLLIVSFFLDKILAKVSPHKDAIEAFNELLLYYFLFDLLMRFQLQELPTLSVKPYLTLPISRKRIVNYLSLTSLWSGFNVSPFLLTLPFLSEMLLAEGDSSGFLALVISIAALTLFNHFFSLWLKRKINMNAWFMAGFLCSITIIVLADFYLNVISVSTLSAYIFNSISERPFLSLILVLLSVIMYYINHNFLKRNLYSDELHKEHSGRNTASDIPFLRQYGPAGDLAALEIKLILRNKRPKSTLIISAVFMLYGIIFSY